MSKNSQKKLVQNKYVCRKYAWKYTTYERKMITKILSYLKGEGAIKYDQVTISPSKTMTH